MQASFLFSGEDPTCSPLGETLTNLSVINYESNWVWDASLYGILLGQKFVY